MSKRQITIKPTCMRELLAFPAERSALLWEKINGLVSDPLPDGKVKKKLKGSDGIYRLRVADHRVFYRFGDDWVSLLGIRRRREDTYDGIPVGEAQPELPQDEDIDLDELLHAGPPQTFQLTAAEPERALPMALSREWLQTLGVPPATHGALLRCRTEDDLLAAQVPGEVLSRVLDALFPPSLPLVAAQPDLIVPSAEHLMRYKEGDLLGFLLHLDEDQRKLTRWALKGPTMVTGGAGTGKSTVALYRVKEMLERPGATGQERLLFTTYTRALLAVTRQLLEQLLTPQQLERVTVATCDQVAWDIVRNNRRPGKVESDSDALKRLAILRRKFEPTSVSAFEARLQTRALARLSDRYLLEEFDWILTGRGLQSLEEYLEAPRTGRGVAFSPRLRAAVWELYQAFQREPQGERYADLRNEALRHVRQGAWRDHWDFVFVDEAQDLSPAGLALMAEVCRDGDGLFFAADQKQSLYSRNYTWATAHPRLQFRGRTATLKRNYRSTAEIDRAAYSLLRPEEAEALVPSVSMHQGPLPVLVREAAAGTEAEWVARFIRQAARHLHLRQSAAAVLVPSADIGLALAEALSDQGLGARFFAGRDLDLKQDVVKVMTLYSAKGLEFPIVAVCGFYAGTYPERTDFEEPDLYEERMRHERRLLYVAFTRAMRGLMAVLPRGCAHEALNELDDSQWYVEVGA